jgi:hypothetical protein
VALSVLDRARTLAVRYGDSHDGVRLSLQRARLMLALGDDERALAAAEQTRLGARAVADEASEVGAGVVAARAHLSRGDPFQAEPLLDALRKRAKDPHAKADVAAATARAKVMRARTASGAPRERLLKSAQQRAREALELIDGVIDGPESSGSPASPAGPAALAAQASPASVQARAALADALLLADDPGAAFPHAQRAAELVDDAPPGPWLDEALAAYVRVLSAMGDDDEKRDVLDRARVLADRRAARLDEDTRARFYGSPERVELLGPPPARGEAA